MTGDERVLELIKPGSGGWGGHLLYISPLWTPLALLSRSCTIRAFSLKQLTAVAESNI